MKRCLWLMLVIVLLATPVLAADQPVRAAPAAPQKVVGFDFEGLALAHALRLWSDLSGFSYVTVPADLEKRPIAMHSGKPLTADEALRAIVAAGNLDYTRVGNTYVFAQSRGASTGSTVNTDRLVSVDLREAPLEEALRIVFRDTPYSFVIAPTTPKDTRVTLSLNDMPFSQALQVLGVSADVMIQKTDGNVYRVEPVPTVTIAGQRVPMLGTIGVGRGGGQGADLGSGGLVSATDELVTRLGPAAAEQVLSTLGQVSPSGAIAPPAFRLPNEPVVDLIITKVPLREAVAQIAKTSHLDVSVHPAVSDKIRVTAKMYQVPAVWLLKALVQQAHLVLQETRSIEGAGPEGRLRTPARYLITPLPELSVTGVPETPGGGRRSPGPIPSYQRMLPNPPPANGVLVPSAPPAQPGK